MNGCSLLISCVAFVVYSQWDETRLVGDDWSPWNGGEEEIDNANGDIPDCNEIRKMKE